MGTRIEVKSKNKDGLNGREDVTTGPHLNFGNTLRIERCLVFFTIDRVTSLLMSFISLVPFVQNSYLLLSKHYMGILFTVKYFRIYLSNEMYVSLCFFRYR